MAFEKGVSGNLHGRPPGTANRATQTVRDKFAQLLDGYDLDQLRADLAAIENPKDRLHIILGLAEFVTPKLQRTSLLAAHSLMDERSARQLTEDELMAIAAGEE